MAEFIIPKFMIYYLSLKHGGLFILALASCAYDGQAMCAKATRPDSVGPPNRFGAVE
jgi:hypothetical protein